LAARYNSTHRLERQQEFVFYNLWRSAAPSRACALVWQLLLNRIQSKENLWKRSIIQEDQIYCVFCDQVAETGLHLFLHCNCTMQVWYQVMKWLGLVVIPPPNLFMSLEMLIGYAKGKRQKEGLVLIWISFMWVIWKVRNDRIFNNGEVNVEDMVDQIKVLSWQWFISRVAKGPCLLYEWSWSPFDCFGR
jgi:hypothetical protein